MPLTAQRAPVCIAQAKKMPQAPEGAVRGGAIFPRHMHDQLQRKQQPQKPDSRGRRHREDCCSEAHRASRGRFAGEVGGVGEGVDGDRRSEDVSGDDESTDTRPTPVSTNASEEESEALETPDDRDSAESDRSEEPEHAVAVVETAAVPIKPKKRSLYGGRYQRRSPGQSSPGDH